MAEADTGFTIALIASSFVVVFGLYMVMAHPQTLGGVLRAFGIEIRSETAGGLLIAIGLVTFVSAGAFRVGGLPGPDGGPRPSPPPSAKATVTEPPPPTQPSAGPSVQIGQCPGSPDAAAALFGGDPSYWRRLNAYAWKYGPAPASPIENFTVPPGMKGDWWDDHAAHSTRGQASVGYASEATIWCTG
jgi:hypothetical protein